MNPYREPGVASAPDEDMTKLLEERIVDRAYDLRQRGVSGDLIARVSPMSFRSMTLRLGAKIDFDESGQECFLMYTASGQVLVVASQVITGERYILEKLGAACLHRNAAAVPSEGVPPR